MGLFSKIFKGFKSAVKKVVRGVKGFVKKAAKSKVFRVAAAVAMAVAMPQLLPTIGNFVTSTVPKFAADAFTAITGGISKIGGAARGFISNAYKGTQPFRAWFSNTFPNLSDTFSSISEPIMRGMNWVADQMGFKIDPNSGVLDPVQAMSSKGMSPEEVMRWTEGFAQRTAAPSAEAFAKTAEGVAGAVSTATTGAKGEALSTAASTVIPTTSAINTTNNVLTDALQDGVSRVAQNFMNGTTSEQDYESVLGGIDNNIYSPELEAYAGNVNIQTSPADIKAMNDIYTFNLADAYDLWMPSRQAGV